MRVIRRITLLVSLVLLVAIAVGAIVRTQQVAAERDRELVADAEIAAVRVGDMRDHVRLAAMSGGSPSDLLAALSMTEPGANTCVIDAATVACTGGADSIPAAEVDRARARLADPASFDGATPPIDVYDGVVTMTAVRDGLAVLVQAPVTAVDAAADDDVEVWVATRTDSHGALGEFVSADGQRQISVPIDGATDLVVAATGPDDVSLPLNEQRIYAIAMVLGLVLLALAGFTVYLEQRSLRERAALDSLTRLANRAEFERRAADHIGGDHAAAACLLLFDLDGFKQVNDTYGHLVGDEVLRIISGRLRTAVRDDDIVARWGGDEFVVLMPGAESAEMGLRRAEQLSEAVSGRARIDSIGTSLRLKASVGVAMAPEHGTTLEDLIESADMAMYRAKRAGVPMHLAHRPDRELISSFS